MAAALNRVYGEPETEASEAMRFLFKPNREKEAAQRLYAACLEAARRPGLFSGFGVADTLQGRFEMLTLHLFPVLYRMMHAPGDDPRLARAVSEAFVDDMDAAFRELGVSDVRVPRRMKALYRSFAGRIDAYKRALETGEDALAEALARNVYAEADAAGREDGRALALRNYLQSAVTMIQAAEIEALRAGRPLFPAPPSPSDTDPQR